MNPKSQPEDIQESELVDMATLETINTDPEVVL
jgi:hypothetical protein